MSSTDRNHKISRRAFLKGAGVCGAAALTGCTGANPAQEEAEPLQLVFFNLDGISDS